MKAYQLEATPGADLDVEAAFDWYEAEDPGVGTDFLGELRHAYQRILKHPFSYEDLRSGIRRH